MVRASRQNDSAARAAICQKGVVLNRVEAGREGGNSVCTSWLKGEALICPGGDLEDKRNCRYSAMQTKVMEGNVAMTQQQPGLRCCCQAVNCGYREGGWR